MSPFSDKWSKQEIKHKAILLAEEIGCNRAASLLGMSSDRLSKWVQHKNHGKSMSKKDSPEAKAALLAEREIRKLKKENEELKTANLILKELASVFSKDPLPSNSGWSLNSMNKKNQK